MNPLRVEQMTVFDVEPAEVVSIASRLEVPAISLWVFEAAGMPGVNPVTAANKGAVLERLADAPVRVETTEVFALQPDVHAAEPGLALAAELGAEALVAIDLASEEASVAAEQLARLCELAARYQLRVHLEPIWMGRTRTPAEGLRVVRASGAPNAGLVIDALHVVRSGSSPAELAGLPPEFFGSAQICDGPARIDPGAALEEATAERGVPGSGDFPLEDFLRALVPRLSLGVEVPQRRARERGESALERTRRVVDATRRLQRRVAEDRKLEESA